jgi:uncharacterized membrane protein
MMKKNFISGAAIFLPILLTVLIVSFLINTVTRPFQNLTESLLLHFAFFHNNPLLASFLSKALILILLIGIVFLFGVFGTHYLVDSAVKKTDRLLNRIPLINKIYRANQEVIKTFFHQAKASFTQVVLVPFPQKDRNGIGFVTSSSVRIDHPQGKTEELVSVFVPGTPNPTAGYLLLYKPEDASPSSLTVEEGVQFIVSFGTSMPDSRIA